MLCQRCGEREAVNHEVTIRNGKSTEHHLCDACAADIGLSGAGSPTIAELLPGLLASGVGVPDDTPKTPPTKLAARAGQACDACGLTFAEFKRCGLLGCEGCYEAFEPRLAPLIERAHEGGGHHVGKVPRRALADSRRGEHPERLKALLGDQKERAERLATLRKQLDRAVTAEQYERAAAIRDEIRKVSDVGGEAEGGGS